MSDTDDPNTDETTTRPACPNCGQPVVVTTVSGPFAGFATPCGCRVPPKGLTDSRPGH
ncbi:hypothetical protein [Natronorubrum halophilum]|uniref:hypothetical protein n=1 Tax=Natronorubrum halophilum TaxID=1702106 RepID=UPI0013CF1834|nr:hypothetical protein [Natronorubrum halophilum]